MPPRKNYLLRFLGISVLVFFILNVGLTKFYLRYRYRRGSSEWSQKTEVLARRIQGGKGLNLLFVGDSTISCGVTPRAFDEKSFNLAWSGFEPSELDALKMQILALPERPRKVYIGINPSFLSQNEWRNSFDLPIGAVVQDALMEIYSDSNSMKPFILMGGVSAMSARYLQPPASKHRKALGTLEAPRIEADGLLVMNAPGEPQAGSADQDLKFRAVNFRLLMSFRNDLMASGIQLGWIRMPYSRAFEQSLRSGAKASLFMAHADLRIRAIFGQDVIDLSGSVPDSFFRDSVHLKETGAVLLSQKLGCVLGFPVRADIASTPLAQGQ